MILSNRLMLTGADLGKAIRTAIKLRWKTYAAAARFFEVKPESIQGWMKSGAISKPNFMKLKKEVASFVPPDHWGDDNDIPFSLNAMEVHLVEMYRQLPERFQAALMQDANKYHNLSRPETSAANPFNGAKPG